MRTGRFRARPGVQGFATQIPPLQLLSQQLPPALQSAPIGRLSEPQTPLLQPFVSSVANSAHCSSAVHGAQVGRFPGLACAYALVADSVAIAGTSMAAAPVSASL